MLSEKAKKKAEAAENKLNIETQQAAEKNAKEKAELEELQKKTESEAIRQLKLKLARNKDPMSLPFQWPHS